MRKIISKFFNRLFLKQWIIGLSRGDIKEIIRTKNFSQNITWLPFNKKNHFYADPFLLKTNDGNLNIFIEDYGLDTLYGNISLITCDRIFNKINYKIILDTKSHLSYPFIYSEKNKIYVFPEAGQSGKLSCFEYDQVNQCLIFVQDIINLPLRDATILKYNEKYWIFAVLNENGIDYKLNVYFSDNLLGPYTAHPGNPLKNGLNGTRPAGNFIEVDGIIYRPTQNCKNSYGESITINKVNILDESMFIEEPYMTISINKKNKYFHRIFTIHTINVLNDVIVVDGQKWIFAPLLQLKYYLKNKNYYKQYNKE